MKIYHLTFLLLSAFFGFYSCSETDVTNNAAAFEPVPINLPPLLQRALAAHGSLETWQSYKKLTFKLQSSLRGNESTVTSVVDLQNRREIITSATYEIGYDGERYWYNADTIQEGHPDPKFYINLQFYFFGMPFVIADPGINYENLGQRMLDSQAYNVLKVTYADTIGQAPEDQYLLYFHPETNQMHLLLYSVTYFDGSQAENFNALVYEEWQEVNGLLVAKRAVNRAWNSETQELGEERGYKIFSDVSFETATPEDVLFEAPEGAEIR